MNIEEIEKLPDILPVTTLKTFFENILTEFSLGGLGKEDFLLLISELTERQVMTYELLEISLRKRVDEILCKLWNIDSYEDVDIMLYIIVNLGLENCFKTIKQSLTSQNKIDKAILTEISDTIDEVGDHITNPYYNLEKYK